MPDNTTNYSLLHLIFDHGITVEQMGDVWKIKATRGSSGATNLDLARTYASFDQAVDAIVNVARTYTAKAA